MGRSEVTLVSFFSHGILCCSCCFLRQFLSFLCVAVPSSHRSLSPVPCLFCFYLWVRASHLPGLKDPPDHQFWGQRYTPPSRFFPQEFCGANSILRACKGSALSTQPSLSPSLFLLIEFIQKTNKLPIRLLGEKQQQQQHQKLKLYFMPFSCQNIGLGIN